MIFEKKITVKLVNPNGLFASTSPAGFSISGTQQKEVLYTIEIAKAIKAGILMQVSV